MQDQMICPRPSCGGAVMHQVHYGQPGKVAWCCMRCDTVYTFREIEHEDGELSRVSVWVRKKTAN